MPRYNTNLKIASGKIDFVPLADVVFLLLIFFLLSTSYVFQPGIKVDLPVTVSTSMQAANKVIVTLTANGYVFINDKRLGIKSPVKKLKNKIGLKSQAIDKKQIEEKKKLNAEIEKQQWEDLERELRDINRKKKAVAMEIEGSNAKNIYPSLIIRADKNVEYDKIVHIMSLARSCGMSVYLLTTLKKEVQ